MKTTELAAELGVSVAKTKRICADALPDQVVEYSGWRLVRHSDPSPTGSRTPIHHYEILSRPGPIQDGWYPLADIVDETGIHRNAFSPSSFKGGTMTRYGWVIERHREPEQSRYCYRIVTRGGRVEEEEAKGPVCCSCGVGLTPRRAVKLAGLEHCVSCNRAAFIDGCQDTRRRIGI